jgi:hypothetical protein
MLIMIQHIKLKMMFPLTVNTRNLNRDTRANPAMIDIPVCTTGTHRPYKTAHDW